MVRYILHWDLFEAFRDPDPVLEFRDFCLPKFTYLVAPPTPLGAGLAYVFQEIVHSVGPAANEEGLSMDTTKIQWEGNYGFLEIETIGGGVFAGIGITIVLEKGIGHEG